jgi:anaerobic ribonucleoside-triphosphate reductase activating protein
MDQSNVGVMTIESSETVLRIHSFLPLSYSNGPGKRAVIWVQGCTLDCPGCFNPETHSPEGGELVSIDELFQRFRELGNSIEGISISGGEPLQQIQPLLKLLKRVREETEFSVLIFTGFNWEEIQRLSQVEEFLKVVDVIISGRYDISRPVEDGLRTSANQEIHVLTGRYNMGDLEVVPEGEVIITKQGEIILSGTNPIKW